MVRAGGPVKDRRKDGRADVRMSPGPLRPPRLYGGTLAPLSFATMVSSRKLAAAIFLIVGGVSAFAPPANSGRSLRIPQESTSQLHIFGNAFANDDSLGKRDNPGLKKVRACIPSWHLTRCDLQFIKCSSLVHVPLPKK